MNRLKFLSFNGILLFLVFAVSPWLQAAQVNTAALEAITGKHGLDDSDRDDVIRAYRGAVNVGINAKRLEGLIGDALSEKMEVKYLVRAVVLTTNASLNGLPVSPMLNKFSEGLAKKVDGRDLVEAMEKRALSLQQARKILSVLIYEDKPLGEFEMVLVSAASALERGVDERSIEKVFKQEGPDIKKILQGIENLE